MAVLWRILGDDELLGIAKLLDKLASSISYDYVMLWYEDDWCDSCSCIFGNWAEGGTEAKTADGKSICIDAHGDISRIPASRLYKKLARKLHKILENGDALHVAGKKIYASMVPEFMMGCVLNGVA